MKISDVLKSTNQRNARKQCTAALIHILDRHVLKSQRKGKSGKCKCKRCKPKADE